MVPSSSMAISAPVASVIELIILPFGPITSPILSTGTLMVVIRGANWLIGSGASIASPVSASQAVRRRPLGLGMPAVPPAPALLVPCVMRLPQGELSMFTTLTTFGTPRDVTLDDAKTFRLDLQQYQERELLVWSEAAGLVPLLALGACFVALSKGSW